jgi:hypothetical protein
MPFDCTPPEPLPQRPILTPARVLVAAIFAVTAVVLVIAMLAAYEGPVAVCQACGT